MDDLDLAELAQYPTDNELAQVSDIAAQEVVQLCAYVGIEAAKLLSKYIAPPRGAHR